MSYNKFTKLSQLKSAFDIEDRRRRWLPTHLKQIKVSEGLLNYLAETEKEPLETEKAKSEYIIAPILRELRRNNPNRFSSFSGYELAVNKSQGLTGFCDFILSAEAERTEITAPIFCLVEAKKDDINKGIAQCAAEMYAAQLFNEAEGKPRKVIFGCVTTAFLWCFLKLENKTIYIDPNYIPLTFTEPQRVLTILQCILDECLEN